MQRAVRNPRGHEEALLYSYLARALNDRDWAELASTTLNRATERIAYHGSHWGLYGGLCGLGWVLEHVSGILQTFPEQDSDQHAPELEEDEDLNADLDAALLGQLRHSWRGGIYDLIGGLVGIGVYCLERLPRSSAKSGLKLTLDRLEEMGQQTTDGLTWHTPPELLPDWQKKKAPGGYYNLGVAHGIPGVLYLLAEMQTAEVEADRAARMLDSAMHWFLAQRLPPGAEVWFNSWIPTPGEATNGGRPSWCYGDLGVAIVLYQIARRTKRADWQKLADELLTFWIPTESRVVTISGINDPHLCHGAAGNAHMFNRLYQASRDPRYREAAIFWLEKAMAFRRPDGGVAGFYQYTCPDPGGPTIWEPSPAFLDGAQGLAMGLLAALTSVEPHWDRMLLLSGRPF